jgi:catechol 2,3-dioxygenase-like lactoylglutathione lyase family enzyme
VIGNTEVSLRFYRDLLGMRVVGESENYGTEQEHLNNVFGAHLRITALHGANGPGIELLEYLAPRDGRPFPGDEHANDVVHRQTVLVTRDADSAAHQLSQGQATFVSSGVVENQNTELGFAKAFVVRDPDGHAVEIEEK